MVSQVIQFYLNIYSFRTLLISQVKRDMFEHHAGQLLGGLWSVIHPLSLMAVYLFIFGIVFAARVGGTYDMPLDFTSYILSGLVPWLTIQQSLSKSSVSVTSNSQIIKQVIFPNSILPVKSVFSTLLPFFVMLATIMLYNIFHHNSFGPMMLTIPILVVFLYAWMVGIGLLLGALTVFVRDIKEMVTLFALVGTFLAPVIYLPEWVPPIFEPFLFANPFSYLIWCFQDVFYFGRFEHPYSWVFCSVFSVFLLLLGARVFDNLSEYFGDVI